MKEVSRCELPTQKSKILTARYALPATLSRRSREARRRITTLKVLLIDSLPLTLRAASSSLSLLRSAPETFHLKSLHAPCGMDE
jgi:hypothetical protein